MVALADAVAVEAPVFGADNDDEITKTWEQVEKRVIQMAGGDKSKIKQGLGIESVLSYLDQAQATDKKAAEKYGTIRNAFNRTLQCVQTVGGIVADGASQVFQPANTCYNALTFVIQAWQGYEGIFESLASLLEKCSEFLDRLTYYAAAGMDAKLTKVACQHLQFFVEICDRSIKMRLKRHKFAAFMKQLFLNDDGVQDLLAGMKNLVDKERGLVDAQTWKSSNEAASNSRDGLTLTRKMHNTILENKTQMKREQELLKWRLAIIDALDCDRSLLETDTPEPWEKVWKTHRSNILEGTGEWLFEDPHFKSWLQGSEDVSRILGVEGEEGSGKTLLASNVILHLRKLKTIGSVGSRIVVAHNFFESDSKSGSQTADANVMSSSLMCQLAMGDEPFMKSVATICERSKWFNGPLDMWTQLLLENEERTNFDVDFFIVLDGLGENVALFTKLLQKFTEASLKRTRILLTGKQDLFEYLSAAGGVSIDKMCIGEYNEKDLELFITNRMDSMDVLKDPKRPGVSDIRTKILQDLQNSTGGDYYKVGRVLDNIAKTDEVEEINELLANAGSERPHQIEAEIENLNQVRTTKEVAEINEIISWIDAGLKWMTTDELEACLALRAGADSLGNRTSLMSLESKVKTKYTLFHVGEHTLVKYKLSEMEARIPLKKRDAVDDTSSSGFKDIQPAEVNILRHYLFTVCPKDLYEKFKFDEFFENKLVRKGNYICRDPDNSHINVALRCMTCLVVERNDKTRGLYSYSINNLLYHLEQTDLSLADRELKAQAGIMLVKLLTEPYSIQSLFQLHKPVEEEIWGTLSSGTMPSTWRKWVFTEDATAIFTKWFRDSAVIEKVKEEPLVKEFNAPDADRRSVLLGPACTLAATDVFREEPTKEESLYCFTFILAFLKTKLRSSVSPPKDEADIDIDEGIFTPTLEDVHQVEEWAQESLELSEKDAIWESRAAALLDHLSGDSISKQEVSARARNAWELDSDSWTACFTLSRVLESRDEAIELLETTVDRLFMDQEWCSIRRHQEALALMILDLGNRYWEVEETREKAVGIYSRILEVAKSAHSLNLFSSILANYAEEGKWETIIAFFDEILEEEDEDEETDDEDDQPNMAGLFVIKQLWENADEFEGFVSKAAMATGRLDLLKDLFESALAAKPDEYAEFVVNFNYGKALLNWESEEDIATSIWELMIKQMPEDRKHWALDFVLIQLVQTYLKLAYKKGIKTPEAEAYFGKIEALYPEFEKSTTTTTESCAAFARYYQLRRNNLKARQILRNCTKLCLEILSDDDLENDKTSFADLNTIFATCHDIPNNLVVWEMANQVALETQDKYKRDLATLKEKYENAPLGEDTDDETGHDVNETLDGGADEATEDVPKKTVEVKLLTAEEAKEYETDSGTEEDEDEAKPTTQETEIGDVPEPLEAEKLETKILTCDGECGTEFELASEFWTCLSDSGAIQFDDGCYQKLMAGTLERDVCHKDHDLIWVGKRDAEKMDAIPKGSVLIDGRIATFEEWKNEIRARYVDDV
ncbi:hypothetical protein G7046_g4295 [Stylonectria norvegica]|nr:hypothetical protein G7046_g4295 [Stylonectria norvegica]